MALYETIRNAVGGYVPGEQEEIQLKIKPALAPGVASTAPEGQPLSSAAGGGGGGASSSMAMSGLGAVAGTPAPGFPTGPTGFAPGGESIVAPNMRLGQNPQLAGTPSGAYTDDIYEASLAQARHNAQRGYLDILQQLGFSNEQGAFIPGLIETEAARRRADLQHQQSVALEETTAGAQRGGTVFSGRRGTLQARNERPFVTALAQLESDTPLALGKAYQQATDILGQFGIDMNSLIAEATQRKAALERERAQQAAWEAAAAQAARSRDAQDEFGDRGAPPPPPAAGPLYPGDEYYPGAPQYGDPGWVDPHPSPDWPPRAPAPTPAYDFMGRGRGF